MSQFTSHYSFIALAGLLVTVTSQSLVAFELSGSKWFGAAAEIYVDMEGQSETGILWNTAFIAAMDDWSNATPFTFVVNEAHRDPCNNDGLNGVDFAEDFCGSAFGSKTLAVTLRRFRQTLLGEPDIVQADIVFNAAEPFDVFDGRLAQFGPTFGKLDFRRTALHELGHVIGLDHENIKAAIMAPKIGDLDRLQADDSAAVEALYSGLDNCAITDLNFGITNAALNSGDCTVQDLTVGGNDTSFIDIYRFELLNTTELEFSMTSQTLESVLLLASSDLNYLDVDNNVDGDCSSTLDATLPPGSYLLLANTYDAPIKEKCSISGSYQLNVVFLSDFPQVLGSNSSLQGGFSTAQFSGGITANNGTSFGNQFTPADSLDITATITVDPNHVGQAGFLVVAAVVDGRILLLNEQKAFVEAGVNPDPIIRAVNKTLQASETLDIVTDLVPAELGIDSITVDFVIGYGLASNPSEIYFHQVPLNLIVAPKVPAP